MAWADDHLDRSDTEDSALSRSLIKVRSLPLMVFTFETEVEGAIVELEHLSTNTPPRRNHGGFCG